MVKIWVRSWFSSEGIWLIYIVLCEIIDCLFLMLISFVLEKLVRVFVG